MEMQMQQYLERFLHPYLVGPVQIPTECRFAGAAQTMSPRNDFQMNVHFSNNPHFFLLSSQKIPYSHIDCCMLIKMYGRTHARTQ